MAKELPYFRFTVQEWQNGDIDLEPYEIKGLFIDICGFYWLRDCAVTKELLFKKYRNDLALLEQCFTIGVLKVDEQNGFVSIGFLDEQFDLLSEKRKKRQKAGKLGGLKKASNAKATPKQKSSYNDNDNDNYNLPEKPKFPEDSNEFILSEYLFKKIKSRNPNHKAPNFQNWSAVFDKILRIDKRDKSDVSRVIKWAQEDYFWQNNILSPGKLREQYDQLYLKMSQSGSKQASEDDKRKSEELIKQQQNKEATAHANIPQEDLQRGGILDGFKQKVKE
jgi:hypothetical protein